jgi:hypothetical protein
MIGEQTAAQFAFFHSSKTWRAASGGDLPPLEKNRLDSVKRKTIHYHPENGWATGRRHRYPAGTWNLLRPVDPILYGNRQRQKPKAKGRSES